MPSTAAPPRPVRLSSNPASPVAALSPAPAAPGTRTWPYFNARHPQARPAWIRCRSLHAGSQVKRVGGVACGACWEHAIRTDERFVIECGLQDAPAVPADDIDEVAVARAVAGHRVLLTDAERAAVVRLLAARDLPPARIAELLHTNIRTVARVLRAERP
jgi:hypothetical protein